MSTQVAPLFVQSFEAEVLFQYQQMGSKLRNTVRTKNNIKGATTDFLKVIDRVECILQDYFAGDWVDKMDELKTNINEQQAVARAAAYALGRKTDELIVDQLAASENYADGDTDGLTKPQILKAFDMLLKAGVPRDGHLFAVVGWKQWSDLLKIEDFANADYVGEDHLPWKGTQAKRWLDTLWMPHSGLPKSKCVRQCFWYHKNAVGHAIGSEVKTDITWFGDRSAYFINNMMGQGACLIDGSGVVTMRCLES